MRKKVGILLAVMICLAAVLSGCGKKAASSGENIRILFTLNDIDTFRQNLVDAAKKAAEEQGVQLDVLDSQDSIENQVSHMKQAVSGGYDIILCTPVSIDTVVELKASAGEIPIVFLNSCPDDKQLKADRYIYVGSNEGTAGQYQAEYVLDKLAGKEEINVILLKGAASHSATLGRTKGVKQALEKSGKKINYVFEDYADWGTEKASEMFDIFLKTGSIADCVICNNDSMALGAVEACKNAGIDLSQFPILGVDATAEGCAAIKNGEMAFTVYQSAKGQGQAAIEAAIKLASGGSVKNMEGISDDGKYVWVPFEKVDSSNVDRYAP